MKVTSLLAFSPLLLNVRQMCITDQLAITSTYGSKDILATKFLRLKAFIVELLH